MSLSRRNKKALVWLRRAIWKRPSRDFGPRRGPVIHVVILDGTMSSLEPGNETNAGRAYRLCREMGAQLSVYYEPGVQWSDWRSARDVVMGKGINRQIRRAYGYLASRYRPGDKIFLLGYSRGAFAVRSLAGIIDMIGLLHADQATERNVRDAYRHYEGNPNSPTAVAFAKTRCLRDVPIEMIGVWDTVKSLGLNAPLLWRLTEDSHSFHSHDISHNVKAGFHALALHETREAYAPVLWTSPEGHQGRIEQVWFPGTHGDVGGQLGGFEAARPLANIPLVWMMGRAQLRGLPLPEGWAARFPQDATAPMLGTFRGYGKWFVTRHARKVGADLSESVHESVGLREAALPPTRNWTGWGRTV